MKFSQFPKDVMEHSVKYTLREIENVIKKYGPRESATEAEFQAQRHMAKELDQWCDSVKTEEFSTSNHAFLHFTKIDSILMLLSMAAYFAIGYGLQNWIWATVVVIVGFTICYVLMFGEFLFYKEFTDRFYKQKTSHNVTAVRRPSGEVKRRIIVSGHADSAYEWSLTYHFGHIGLKIVIFGTILCGLLMILFAISTLFVGMESPFTIYGRYVSLIGLPFYFGLYFFANFKRVVPGANDNLTGCYAAVCMMQLLEEAGVNLEHTEVVSVITGSEESGLRGAKAWAKAHAEEMKDVETIFIGADTLKDLDDFCIYARDLTGMVKHDPQVCKLIHEAAKDAGFDMEYSSVYLGASDAAAITQAGMKAACIAAMDPAPPRYYHTRLDSYEILNPKAIKAGYDVLLSTILKYDEQGLPTV